MDDENPPPRTMAGLDHASLDRAADAKIPLSKALPRAVINAGNSPRNTFQNERRSSEPEKVYVPSLGCPNAPPWVNVLLLAPETIKEWRLACAIYCILEREHRWPTRTELSRRVKSYFEDRVEMMDYLGRLDSTWHAVYFIPVSEDRRGPRTMHIGFSPYLAEPGFAMLGINKATRSMNGQVMTVEEIGEWNSLSQYNRRIVMSLTARASHELAQFEPTNRHSLMLLPRDQQKKKS